MSDDCLFCKIVAGTIPAKKVFEDDSLVAFDDIHPAAPTHVLIVPRKHIATTNNLGPADNELVGKMVAAAAKIAAQRGLAQPGYRLVFNCNKAAGQAVFHIHLHLLGGRNLAWPPG